MRASLTRCRNKFFWPQKRKEREENPDNEKEWLITFDAWIAHTRDESGFCTLQVFTAYFSALLCVLCVFAVTISNSIL
jgi:hypothetical protein